MASNSLFYPYEGIPGKKWPNTLKTLLLFVHSPGFYNEGKYAPGPFRDFRDDADKAKPRETTEYLGGWYYDGYD